MATNDFQYYASAVISALIESQAAWLADSQTTNGRSSGVVPATTWNKIFRQSTGPGAALTQIFANYGVAQVDDGNISNLVTSMLAGFASSGFLANLGFVNSFGTSGYIKLPGGLIIQWNTFGYIATGSTITTTFPITFPNAVYGLLGSPNGLTQGTYETVTSTLSGATLGEGGNTRPISGGFYIAIGR